MIFKNMFQAKTALMAVAMVLFAGGFASCSDDDDDDNGGASGGGTPTLETPAYADVSAKYEITDGGEIASIELTESGTYVVMMNNYYAANCEVKKTWAVATRAASNAVYGKYTKISDTEFVLDGFGTVIIEGSTDNACSLQLTLEGESESVTLGAQKVDVENESATSQALCRSWDINKVNLKVTVSGMGTIYDKTLPASQYTELWKGLADKIISISKQMGDYEEGDEEDYYDEMVPQFTPEQIIITKSGSYMVTYDGNQLAVSYWGWSNINANKFRYSHYGPDYVYDSYYSNECTVSFNGSSMTIYEVVEDYEEGEGMKVTSTYYCSEAR